MININDMRFQPNGMMFYFKSIQNLMRTWATVTESGLKEGPLFAPQLHKATVSIMPEIIETVTSLKFKFASHPPYSLTSRCSQNEGELKGHWSSLRPRF